MVRRALVLLALAGPAAAASSAAAETGPHREGEYGGVSPGQPREAPARPRRPPPKGTLTWVGFEAKDGGAQVFFQSVAPFQVQQHLEGGVLVVHLSLTRLGPNAWRRLDTRFFDNPLAEIVARRVGATRATKARPARGAGIAVRITFKSPRDAREGALRTAKEADGRFYAYLTLPEGAGAGADASPSPTDQGAGPGRVSGGPFRK